jgi:hypothetical protein
MFSVLEIILCKEETSSLYLLIIHLIVMKYLHFILDLLDIFLKDWLFFLYSKVTIAIEIISY